MVPWLAMAGRFEECDERLARMHHLMELMGAASGDDDILTLLSLGLWRGHSAEVAPQIAAMDGGPLPLSATVVACLLRGGADDEARAYAAEHPIDVRGHDDWLSMLPRCHAAEAALGLGDRPLAAQAYATLAPYAGHSSSAGAHKAMGPVDAFLALAAATVDEKDPAAQHAERALELMEQAQILLAADWLRGLRGAVRLLRASAPGDGAIDGLTVEPDRLGGVPARPPGGGDGGGQQHQREGAGDG